MTSWLVAAGVVLLAILGAAFLAQAPGGQTGPELVPPTVEEAATTVVQSSPPTTLAAGETYFDPCLGREWSRDDIPHFLRGFKQYGPGTNPAQRADEAYAWLESRLGYREADTISILFSDSSTTPVRILDELGKDVEVVFMQYAVVDGEYWYRGSTGPVALAECHPGFPGVQLAWASGRLSDEEYAAERQRLSREEFDKVVRFLNAIVVHSIDWLCDNWLGPLQLDLAKYAREDLGVEDLLMPVTDEFTLADIIGLPHWWRDDILPDVIYYGPIGAWGWMLAGPNIPVNGKKPERRMALHEEAVGFDWIIGAPCTTRHEFVHAWQSFPLAYWYDCELFNESLTGGYDLFAIDFLNHSYLKRIRKLALRYWNFDYTAAIQRLRKLSVGGVYLYDSNEYQQLAAYVERMAEELRWATMQVYREFYRDPIFYCTLADMWRDPALPFDLIFAQLYSPTCLGSVEETQKWQVAHRAEILRIGEKTWEEIQDEAHDRYEDVDRPASIAALAYWASLPDPLREDLAAAYEEGGMPAVVAYLQGGDR